jgi:NADH-quinone oxidoreductase subunit D
LVRSTRQRTVCCVWCWSSTAKWCSAPTRIGLLHRATEKLAESKTYIQSLPYMDRLDYVSMMCNEHAYCLAIEKLMGIEVPIRAQYIRVMFSEITRIMNHLMWLGSSGNDAGSSTILIYSFREREALMDMYEAVSGARMHAAYFRPGGVYRDLPDSMPQYKASKVRNVRSMEAMNEDRKGSLLDFIDDFTQRFPKCADEYETLLTDNRIWKQRNVGIGVVSAERAINLGLTGPCCVPRACLGPAQEAALRGLRQAGLRYSGGQDGRLLRPLSGARGRNAPVQPHHQAVRGLAACQPGPVITDNHKVAPASREAMKSNMEELIHHFKLFTEGFTCPKARPMPPSSTPRVSSASTWSAMVPTSPID